MEKIPKPAAVERAARIANARKRREAAAREQAWKKKSLFARAARRTWRIGTAPVRYPVKGSWWAVKKTGKGGWFLVSKTAKGVTYPLVHPIKTGDRVAEFFSKPSGKFITRALIYGAAAGGGAYYLGFLGAKLGAGVGLATAYALRNPESLGGKAVAEIGSTGWNAGKTLASDAYSGTKAGSKGIARFVSATVKDAREQMILRMPNSHGHTFLDFASSLANPHDPAQLQAAMDLWIKFKGNIPGLAPPAAAAAAGATPAGPAAAGAGAAATP